ncbi:MAG: segregation and condensation protein A [Pseudomonadota bacterium]
MSDNPIDSQESRILRAMKQVLTGVIKDTSTPPGHRHPLTDRTIEDIRQCLVLISARERELVEAGGQASNLRPYYTDDPQAPKVIPIASIGKNTRKPE